LFCCDDAEVVLLAARATDADPLAVGLVCAALRHPDVSRSREAREATVRLETVFGGRQVPSEALERLGEAAEASARELFRSGYAAVRPVLEKADALLSTLKADGAAAASDLLPSGFELRLRRAATALRDVLKGKGGAGDLEAAAREAGRHLSAERFQERVEAVRMAARLARWLSTPQDPDGSMPALAEAYAKAGSWVDVARARIAVSEPVKELAAAYRDLKAAVTARREAENERFARAVAPWNGQALPAAGLIAVERLLDAVVAPLAKEQPVLLLVLDGMSYAVFRQLLGDVVERHGWMEAGPEALGRRLNAVAVLPTLTEVSRTSLLSGALRTGTSADEKAAFAAHRALVAACRPGRPPALFHKAEVGDGAFGPSEAVAEALQDPESRVVGVVVNAVDDSLDKGDQVLPRWSLGYIPILGNLLDAAESAGRVVVVTSDHGHVAGEGTVLRTVPESGERSRPPVPPAGDGEVLASGPRVLAPGGKVVMAWSEAVRYAPKKAGYHGGATPQEAVVPVSVLTRRETPPKGWGFLPPETPDWWEEAAAGGLAAGGAAPASGVQVPLFGPHAEKAKSVVPALLASEAFRSQLDSARRTGLTEEHARKVLAALEARGGTMTRTALARELNVPELRVDGLTAALRRVLNVEGYPVLSADESGSAVVLNLDLLVTQFEL
ncbi:BREX-2 system phosphatase PglZ, partial [Acidobacteria bacterium ACD]|nr:BREX-2 system phosphatase PglZ [Acidobacteria bacterium ACD]